MATINNMINVTGTAGAVPASPQNSQGLQKTLAEIPSEYLLLENSKKVAEMAEVEGRETPRASQADYERHKDLLSKLEQVLKRMVGKAGLDKGRTSGLVQYARDQAKTFEASASREGDGEKKTGFLNQAGELRAVVGEIEEIQSAMEKRLEAQGPVDLPKTRTDLAMARLQSFYGEKIPEELRGDPARIRGLVVNRLKTNLDRLAEGRKRAAAEIQRWQRLLKSGNAEEKARAEKALSALRSQLERFSKGEALYSKAIVHSERWVRELEKGTIEVDLAEGFIPGFDEMEGGTTVRTSSASTALSPQGRPERGGRGPLLGTASAGHETDYDIGASDYLETSGMVQAQDFTGTNLAVIQSSGNTRQEYQRTKRVIDQIVRRLMAGDYRVLDLALIMLGHQASMTTINVGVKMIRALEQQDQHQQEVVDKLDQLRADDPTFASQTSAANMQVNKIAVDRQATMNLLRTALTSMEEIQNVAKSYLDIQGAQIRQLSRFNT